MPAFIQLIAVGTTPAADELALCKQLTGAGGWPTPWPSDEGGAALPLAARELYRPPPETVGLAKFRRTLARQKHPTGI
jgi:hypothetical protein